MMDVYCDKGGVTMIITFEHTTRTPYYIIKQVFEALTEKARFAQLKIENLDV